MINKGLEWQCCYPTISLRDHQKFFPGRWYRTVEVVFSFALFISGMIIVAMGFHLSITAVPLTFVAFFKSLTALIDSSICVGFIMTATSVLGYLSNSIAALKVHCALSAILFCFEIGVGAALVAFQCQFPFNISDLTSCLECYARLERIDVTIPVMSGILIGIAVCHLLMLYIMAHHISFLKLYKDISDQDFSLISSPGYGANEMNPSVFLPSSIWPENDARLGLKCPDECYEAQEMTFLADSRFRFLPVVSTPIESQCSVHLPCTGRCCNLLSEERTKALYRTSTSDSLRFITSEESNEDYYSAEASTIQHILNTAKTENSEIQDARSISSEVLDQTVVFRNSVQALLPVLLKDKLGPPSCLKDPFLSPCSPPPPPPPTPATPSEFLPNVEVKAWI